ncbi:MAG: phasin family protein [Verrucomicrobiae bacterium]|nr:phasin family protein [Verrucomicrobiae bacterium]NNJ73662.1 phasin family protein [Anderseniella sp.]NNJ86054.1 phasin family protein [Akkermansiaceae bacterium]
MTNKSKSVTIDTDKETNNAVARTNGAVIESPSDKPTQFGNFVSKRLTDNFAMRQRLMTCKTPLEVAEVWAGFYQTAMQDYSTQTGIVSNMIRGSVSDTADVTHEISKTAGVKKDDKPA